MIKNVFGILAIAAIMLSCGNSTKEKKSETEAAPLAVEFNSLIENPAEYLDKDITIEGNVVHVCKHSGKKMFIVGENPDIRLFITAGEEVPVFPMELLGSTISVSGHLTMVEAGEKKGDGSGEGEHAEEGEQIVEPEKADVAAEGEDCETEAAVAAQPVLSEYVLHYKSHEVK
jgi:hypothetical protein